MGRGRYFELPADPEHGPSLDLAVPRYRRGLAVTHPDVVGGTVSKEPRTMLPEPAFERSSAHSVCVLTTAFPRSRCEVLKQLIE